MPMNPRLMRPLAAAPSGPSDPDFASVALLLHMDGANASTTFTDSSSNARTVTVNGGAQLSTSQSQYGGASGYFDAVDSYLSVADDPTLALGSDWTIEFWMYPLSWSATRSAVSKGLVGDVFNGCWAFEPSGPYMTFFADVGAGVTFVAQSGVIPLNQWIHMAVVCNAGVVTVYQDGVGGSPSGSISLASGNTGDLYIGAGWFSPSSRAFDGYIDEFRITNGAARYTANFTPPAAPFPNQ